MVEIKANKQTSNQPTNTHTFKLGTYTMTGITTKKIGVTHSQLTFYMLCHAAANAALTLY